MRAISQILILLAAVGSAFGSPFSWVVKDGESLELVYKQSDTLVRFQLNPQPADPHFDILKRVGGENLLWVGPDDHPWHYGQWFSWKFINDVNFWETDRETGRSEGLTEVSEARMQLDGNIARISYTRHYRTQSEMNPVLRDEFVVKITAPEAEAAVVGPIVEWTVTTTALADVTLDRTPLPNEPGGKPYGGYGGLSWRGSAALNEVRFTDSEGREGMEIHRQRARWVNAVGALRGKSVGLAVIAPTVDTGQDRSWFLSSNEKLPFWYINPAILQPKPLVLKQGASFAHNYRVVVHDGSWSPESE